MNRKHVALYQRLVGEYTTSVYRYFCRWQFSVDEAEDLTQEAYLEAWKSVKNLRDEGSPKAWLLKICRRLAWKHTQSRIRKHEKLVTQDIDLASLLIDSDVESQHERQSELRLILQVLSELSKAHEEVLHLHYLQDLKEREVAVVLGIPKETVHSRLRVARNKFKQAYFEARKEPT